ncbi:MAG: hypothetical protein QXJ34_01640 [Candidatus Pacearchaeota archaeon]
MHKMQLSKIDAAKIRYLLAFERFTGIKTIECFNFNKSIVFMVNPMLIKAFRKKQKKIKELSRFLKADVKILAMPKNTDAETITKFVNRLVAPHTIKGINLSGQKLTINSGISKAFLLGKGKKNLPLLKELFKKYFKISELEIR